MNNNKIIKWSLMTNRVIRRWGSSSHDWMTRQKKDLYVKKARLLQYRARSAFKLIEMDDSFSILRPGQVIVECGAAPGAWTQVCAQRTNANGNDCDKPKGKIIALDLNYMEPVKGAVTLHKMDITLTETHRKVLHLLNGNSVDVLLSDMAPQVSGVRDLDHELSKNLVYAAMRLALLTLNVEGTFLVKLLEGGTGKTIENDLLRFFKTVRFVKPKASRKESPEIYFLAAGFQGVKIK